MKITLINHACCRIEAGGFTLLTDPWVEGPAFNLGWDLLVPTPWSVEQILEGVTHLWISHEHPDHFSVPFLLRAAKTHKDRITVLFQKTRDRRVAGFCESQGFKVIEMEYGSPVSLPDGVTATCHGFDFYDSWLHLTDGQHSLVNLNDCAMRQERDLDEVVRMAPAPTVLMTQFSYAAWKGGRENRSFRQFAAQQKLGTLAMQTRLLKPVFVMPFASMIYFSSTENDYLNDAANTPRVAAEAIQAAGAKPAVLFPGDAWTVGDGGWNSEAALARYDAAYAAIPTLPRREPGPTASLVELQEAFAGYRTRLLKRNAAWLLYLLRAVPGLGAFRPLHVRLWDSGTRVSVSPLDGIRPLPDGGGEPEVSMHSSSLLFILKNEFGYDTLTVNGRFEASAPGFAKMTRSLAIGSLNAMGLSLSLGLFANLRVVAILLGRLRGVMRRLGATAPV